MSKIKRTPELDQILRDSASLNPAVRGPAMAKIAKAVETPIREGIMSGNILGNIFEVVPVEVNTTVEYPLDFISPGTEDQYVAYTQPGHGLIPYRHVEGDYVQIPIYHIAASIDWDLKFAADARWDIMSRISEVMEAQFVKKMNDDGWHTLLTAAFDRNIIVTDTDASAGQFTKRLVSLLKVVMRRNGGGNSTSVNRSMLTDLYLSPEAMEDIRNWNVDQVDEVTRREIFLAEGDGMNRIFGVNLGVLDELGEGQEYQLFFNNQLSGTLPGGDVELVVGLDRSRNDSFIMPLRQDVEIYEDTNLLRHQMAGLFGWARLGFAVLNSVRVIFGSL